MSAITVGGRRPRWSSPSVAFGLALAALAVSVTALVLALVAQHRPSSPPATSATKPGPTFAAPFKPPVVVGMTAAAAAARLKALGYIPKLQWRYDETTPAGRVAAEIVSSGSGPGATITLNVSKGPAPARHH